MILSSQHTAAHSVASAEVKSDVVDKCCRAARKAVTFTNAPEETMFIMSHRDMSLREKEATWYCTRHGNDLRRMRKNAPRSCQTIERKRRPRKGAASGMATEKKEVPFDDFHGWDFLETNPVIGFQTRADRRASVIRAVLAEQHFQYILKRQSSLSGNPEDDCESSTNAIAKASMEKSRKSVLRARELAEMDAKVVQKDRLMERKQWQHLRSSFRLCRTTTRRKSSMKRAIETPVELVDVDLEDENENEREIGFLERRQEAHDDDDVSLDSATSTSDMIMAKWQSVISILVQS